MPSSVPVAGIGSKKNLNPDSASSAETKTSRIPFIVISAVKSFKNDNLFY
jgi:hypothetical protein